MANGLSKTTIREMVYGTTTDMTKITIERERFEAWARDNVSQPSFSGKHVRGGKWSYNHNFIDAHWRAWQAARAAPPDHDFEQVCVDTDAEGNISRHPRVALRAAQPAEPAEQVAWLHICAKPGRREVYATVDPDDNKWWPADQWTSHTVHPLYAAPPAPAAVPPGMALVPIEPTPEMCRAGRLAEISASTHLTQPLVYRAMIAAAGDKP